MLLNGENLTTLDEAFARLTPEQQAHSERVAVYAEIAFRRAAAMNLYVSDNKGRFELVPENQEYYDYLGNGPAGGNAEDYTWNSLPNGWTRIRYYSGFEPQAGDI